MYTDLSYENLLQWAKDHFQLEEDTVKRVMRMNNIDRFIAWPKPDYNWFTCAYLLRDYYLHNKEFPTECPVCKGKVTGDKHYDGLFGVRYGWKCLADPLHFMIHRTNILREKVEKHAVKQPDTPSQS